MFSRTVLSVLITIMFCGAFLTASAAAACRQGIPNPPVPPPPALPPEVVATKATISAMLQAGRKKDIDAWVNCLTNDSAGTLSVVPLSVIAVAVNTPLGGRNDKNAAAAAAARADFEKLLDSNRIGDFIRQGQITDKVDHELSHRGRDILKCVYHFIERLQRDGLLPPGRQISFHAGLAKNADRYIYEVIDVRRVVVFDAKNGMRSLEGRFEKGQWRLQISRDATWDKGPDSLRPKPHTIFL